MTGYELGVLKALADDTFAPGALEALGAMPDAVAGWYSLSLSMARGENGPGR